MGRAPVTVQAVAFGAAIASAGCKFEPVPLAGDGPVDVPVDVPTEQPRPERIAGATALWQFRETAGPMVADAVMSNPVNLTVQAGSLVSFGDGAITFDARSQVDSATSPHVNTDVRSSNAVTFEAWVTPANNTQGAGTYTVIAGITATVLLRNVDLEQRGPVWAARVRTTGTTTNGDPIIAGTIPVDTTKPTHLAVVADGSRRVLYVNGTPFLSTPAGGGSMNWDANYKVRLGDESGGDRHWQGKLWLLALYDQALDEAMIRQNYLAGYDCPDC
ncbi:MAG TPA: LamG domain-containing protein [Kofleriaceae bacterium]|nr:LamG domain-containing protein [Kofleriaceae bacterium]